MVRDPKKRPLPAAKPKPARKATGLPAPKPIVAAVAATIAPAVLLKFQQSWAGCTDAVAIWEKSRRIGASWTTAADAVLVASEAGGMDALYIGYSEDMTREFISDCAMWATSFKRAADAAQEAMFDETGENGDIRQIKTFRIDFASGNKILALSSRPRSIRGKQGLVIIDEASFHDDLPGLIKAAMSMLIWGGRVRILSSHNGEDNPFNVLVKDCRAGKLPYTLFRTTFSDALEAGLYERVKLVLGERLKEKTRAEWEAKIRAQHGGDAAEELDCIPRMGSGAYFPRTLVERAQKENLAVLRYVKPPEWMLYDKRLEEAQRWIDDVLLPAINNLPRARSVVGRDFGRSGDLSIESVLQEISPRKWEATLTLELRRIPFDVQELINFALLDNLPLFHHAKYDARGNGQQLAEAALQRYGVARIECVMASSTWYAANFPPYKAALEDQSCLLTKDEDEIADHRRVVLKKGYPAMDDGRDKGSDGEQRHGDRAVARVLAWAATRIEAVPMEFQSLGRPRQSFGAADYLN